MLGRVPCLHPMPSLTCSLILFFLSHTCILVHTTRPRVHAFVTACSETNRFLIHLSISTGFEITFNFVIHLSISTGFEIIFYFIFMFQGKIIDLLLAPLEEPNSLAAAPLLDLVVHLARDLREDFYAHFDRVFACLIRVVTPRGHGHDDVILPAIIEATFRTLT